MLEKFSWTCNSSKILYLAHIGLIVQYIGKCILSFKIIGYRYHKLRKAFSKFYRRHYKLISKFNVGLKLLLRQGLSEPEFYGDLVYKFKKD